MHTLYVKRFQFWICKMNTSGVELLTVRFPDYRNKSDKSRELQQFLEIKNRLALNALISIFAVLNTLSKFASLFLPL